MNNNDNECSTAYLSLLLLLYNVHITFNIALLESGTRVVRSGEGCTVSGKDSPKIYLLVDNPGTTLHELRFVLQSNLLENTTFWLV
jgi:hypothetical protein